MVVVAQKVGDRRRPFRDDQTIDGARSVDVPLVWMMASERVPGK